MNNHERWLRELSLTHGHIVDAILDSEAWETFMSENMERDIDEVNVLLHQWSDFGITPENEEAVMNLLAEKTPNAIAWGNDPGNAINGFFGYFVTVYKNEHYHKRALDKRSAG